MKNYEKISQSLASAEREITELRSGYLTGFDQQIIDTLDYLRMATQQIYDTLQKETNDQE